MVLLQLLTGSGVEEKQFVQIIGALKLTSAMSDPEFEVILNLFDRVCEKKVIYSKETCELCIGMLSQMQVKNAQNQKVQAWLAFQNKTHLPESNPYYDTFTQKKGKVVETVDLFVSKILERPQKYLPFLLGLF